MRLIEELKKNFPNVAVEDLGEILRTVSEHIYYYCNGDVYDVANSLRKDADILVAGEDADPEYIAWLNMYRECDV
jgi:hypothetical protein